MINKKISVVVPCYNEEKNIREMYRRLKAVLDKITEDYEIIYTDNCSTDNSRQVFEELANQDKKVSVIFFARNFGNAQYGYTAGLEYASGEAMVIIDGDLQDPPELIEPMVQKWLEGYQVVYGLRSKREARGFIRKIAPKLFYRLIRKLSYLDMPLDAGEFSLLDRRVVDVINSMPERNRFLRGLRVWAGFKHIGVPYIRAERRAGKSTSNIWTNIREAQQAIFSFSYAPLELISYLALFIVGLAILGIIIYVALYFILPDTPRGIPTIIVLVLFMGGIQLLCLSIIGQYLGRIFEETKQRPKYIVKEILNDHRKDKSGQNK